MRGYFLFTTALNTIRNERTYDVLSIHSLDKVELVQNKIKYSEKATSPNKQKKKRKKLVWLSGRLDIGERLNEGPRLQRNHEDENDFSPDPQPKFYSIMSNISTIYPFDLTYCM